MNSIFIMTCKLTLVFLLFIAGGTGLAATIKGKLLDENKSPMTGASIRLKTTNQYAVTGLDGSYTLHNVKPGEHILSASFIGYLMQDKVITIQSDDEALAVNFNLEPDPKLLDDVIISATAEGGSELEARKTEKNANHVMNIVSAKTIELSPDITVANVIQRVSGISLVRNSSGDPQYAIVRGMDKRYNYTLVNGIKIPSPDNENRYVPLDIFPASLLERLEVSKALTPAMEGDAIGGVVNMIMKNAPEQLTIKGDLQGGYNQININRDFQKFDRSVIDYKTPSEKYESLYQAHFSDFSKKNLVLTSVKPLPDLLAGLSIGNRYLQNKLGILLAGSYQNVYRGTNSVWFDTQIDYNGTNLPQFNAMQVRHYSTQQVREALHGRFDFVFNKEHKINLYSGWYRLLNAQTRDTKETKLGATGGYDPEAGSAAYAYLTRTRITDQRIFSNTLQGNHTLLHDVFYANWSAVYALAQSDQPDNAQFDRTSGLNNFTESPQSINRNLSRRWDRNTDTDYTGYLNFVLTPSFLQKQHGEFTFGSMYRSKKRMNHYNKYNLDPSPSPQYKGTDWETYDDVKMVVLNPLGSLIDEQNYKAHENLLEYYAQVNVLVLEKLQVLTGVRIEHTDQGYTLLYPKANEISSQNQKYVDVLPSINIKYILNEHMNVRSSYYKAICRPGFFEIVPYYNDNSFTENYASAGNSTLKRIRANNYDLRWEYFPNTLDQILIGTFYKQIIDPIEYALIPYGSAGQFAIQPGNYGNATNWGIEADFIKYFNAFGIRANYTYTNSRITTTKTIRVRENPDDPSSNIIPVNVSQTRPLQGQARHIANFSLLYKNMKKGINTQLAFVYTGERIESVSPFLDNDQWQKPILQMDFSAEKKINQHFEYFIKAQNLLNSSYKVYIKKPNYNQDIRYPYQHSSSSTLTRWDQYYQSYRIGVRYNF